MKNTKQYLIRLSKITTTKNWWKHHEMRALEDTPITSRVTANYSLMNAHFQQGVDSPSKMCIWLNRIKHPVLLCFNNFKYNLMSIHKKEHHSSATPSLFLFRIHLHRFNPNLITHFLLRLLHIYRIALRGVMNDFDLTIYTNIRQIKPSWFLAWTVTRIHSALSLSLWWKM